jgi:phosphoribosyl 1,2-cyclic phosphate phosphodiesterase
LFKGVDLWVVDALRRRPHPSHAHLSQTLEWIGIVAPARAILTHMDHSMDYAGLLAELPDGVEPGYDGLEVSL